MESRSLSKLFIVNAKGLLKLILHFFLTYSYFLRSFLVFYRTIYNRNICSLYHSHVHFTIPCTQWRHLCVDRSSTFRPSTHHPRILISHSFVQLPVHLFNHIETWVVLSAWPVTKKNEKIKNRNLTCWDRQKICEKCYDKNFL